MKLGTSFLGKLLRSRLFRTRKARRLTHNLRRRPAILERLEDRSLLATLFVDNDGMQCATPYTTIQAGINAAVAGDIVQVCDGTYVENVTINKNLTLESMNGRSATTIQGVSNGALGTIRITTGINATIGGVGQGFHIVGVNNPSPGIESAAVYFQGTHPGAQVLDNEIEANGDSGLTVESVTNSNFVIDGNTFSGKTFVGANPAGDGFGAQFTLANVPRQLVVFNNGGTSTNNSFTNNIISGTAGGISLTNNSGAAAPAHEQGNTLVTIDAPNSIISGNQFVGSTNRFADALRSRGAGTSITGNTFNGAGMGALTNLLEVTNNATPFATIVAANTFNTGSGGTLVVGGLVVNSL